MQSNKDSFSGVSLDAGQIATSVLTNRSIPSGKASNVRLANKIKELRASRSLSQVKLAKALGCTGPYISSLESGKRGASDAFLLNMERFFGLKHKTLLSLRGQQASNDTQATECEPLTPRHPDYIEELVRTLQSLEEDYGRRKVTDFIQGLQDDYVNRLTHYEYEEIKEHVSKVNRKWMEENKTNQPLKDDIHMKGYMIKDEYKHYFSLRLNELGLELHLLYEEKTQAEKFESWLGPSNVQYTSNKKMPYMEKEEKMLCIVWFNPHHSIVDMFMYLKDNGIDLQSLEIIDPRFHWYIQQQSPVSKPEKAL